MEVKQSPDQLVHFGIPGMKWGVRKDRSRVSKGSSSKSRSDDSKVAKSLRKKASSEMSNKELETVIKRMQLEKQYKELRGSEVNKGRKIVTDLLVSIGKDTARTFITSAIRDATKGKSASDIASTIKAVTKKQNPIGFRMP